MREIEFRGKTLKANNSWVIGSLLIFGDGFMQICERDASMLTRHSVDSNTVGQYTGLKDRHGAKIFEGDILQDEDKRIGFVEFNKGRFVGDFDGRTYYYELYLDAEKSEVIGNRHDNPEFLEARE